MKRKLTVEEIQENLARLKPSLTERVAAVEALRELVPVDLDTVPDEMVMWQVCPTVAFELHGLLSSALEVIQEGLEHLDAARTVSSATVQEKWARMQAVDAALQAEE